MRKHWLYLRYVLRHKWYVFLACRRRGAPLWASLIHDLSKFRADEWGPYATWFYDTDVQQDKEMAKKYPNSAHAAHYEIHKENFERAFLLHLHRNPHHWQYWILPASGNKASVVYEIPYQYVAEMVADWDGAGRAITGKWDTPTWYARERYNQRMHHTTRELVDKMVAQTGEAYGGTVPD